MPSRASYGVDNISKLLLLQEIRIKKYHMQSKFREMRGRLPQLQMLLANLIGNHNTDLDLYTTVSQDDGSYKPKSRYNSHLVIQTLSPCLKGLNNQEVEMHAKRQKNTLAATAPKVEFFNILFAFTDE